MLCYVRWLTAVFVQAFDSTVRLYHVTVSTGLATDQIPPSPPLPADVGVSADLDGYRSHRVGSLDNLTFQLLFAFSLPRESRITIFPATLREK